MAEPIRKNQIHVWTLAIDDIAPVQWPLCDGILDADEQARAARFLFDRHRRAFVAAHALMRLMLSALAGPPPESWRFAAGPHGKPRLDPPPPGFDLRCNLSHTEGMVLCAVASGMELGVDVEDLDRHPLNLDLADHCFAASEVRWLESLPAAARRDGFFRLWTLKEAYVKATGLGLTQPLQAFTFDPIRIAFDGAGASAPASWRFAQFRPSARHLAALAFRWEGGPPEPALLLRRLPGLAVPGSPAAGPGHPA